jgi:hypothetical protein
LWSPATVPTSPGGGPPLGPVWVWSLATAARGFGDPVSAVTSPWTSGDIVCLQEMEATVNKMMLKFPNSFGEAVKQVFVGAPRVASPDLQNLSDKDLEDIGLVRLRTDFEAIKPFYLQ